jgi:hypothetical protein
MSDTIDALGRKMEPRRLANKAIDAFNSAGGESAVLDLLRRNPIPTLLIAAGASWLTVSIFREGSESREYEHVESQRPTAGQSTMGGIRQSVSDKLQAGKEKVSGLASKASEAASSLGERISGTARSVGDKASHMVSAGREKVSGIAGGTGESVSGTSQKVRERLSRMQPQRSFWDTFNDHPFATAAGFAAAGVLAGLVLPMSRREEEMFGDSANRLVEGARDTGRRTLHETTQKVTSVTRAAADAATERMHGDEPLLDKVKGMVQDAADTAKEQMRKEGLMSDEHGEFEQQGSLNPPAEGPGAQLPEAGAMADRASDAMADRSKASPQQPGDQVGDFTADRPESGIGRNENRKDKKDKHRK